MIRPSFVTRAVVADPDRDSLWIVELLSEKIRRRVPVSAGLARGKTLFEDSTLRGASGHSGPHRTSNQMSDVGTGLMLQVPSLTDVAWRAPYMHNGCAKTLRNRFDPSCGGGDSRGKTSHHTAGQLDELVAFLETL